MTLVFIDTETTGLDPARHERREDGVRPAATHPLIQSMCGWRSPSSDDGYCPCILPVHQGPHRCMHGWLT